MMPPLQILMGFECRSFFIFFEGRFAVCGFFLCELYIYILYITMLTSKY